MISFLQKNLAWALLALILSLALWTLVTFQQNPDATEIFQAVPVEVVNVPPGLTLRNEVRPVEIIVVAPQDVLRQLRPDRFQVVVDASRVAAGLQELPLQVRILEPRARVEQAPSKVLVHLEQIRRKDVPVRVSLQGQVPTGFAARQQPRITPSQVTISGPQSLVDQVSAVGAEVSLDGVRTSINQAFAVRAQTASGQPVDRVTMSPESVLVEITVDQQLAYKTVPITPQVTGTPAFGYQMVAVLVDPSALTVSGEPKVLDDLEFLPTRPVDVSGADGDLALNVEPAWPAGIAPVRQQNLVVRVYVSPAEGSRTMEVAPVVKGLSDGLRATVSPGAIELTLAGPMPVLAGVKPEDVQVTIDASGLVTGTHTVRPRPVLPPLIRALSANPDRVTVAIR